MDYAVWDPFSGKDFNENGDPADVYARHLDEMQEAEQLGFDHYYLIEHQNSSSLRMTSMTTMLAAMTQRTSVIRLGAMIFPLPFFNPIRLAQDAATIDQLSRGRLEFGTGIGVTEAESYRFGLDYSQRREIPPATAGTTPRERDLHRRLARHRRRLGGASCSAR